MAKGIRKRGDKWMVDVTVAGKRRTATCDSYEKAIARRETLKNEATYGQGKAWTIGEALKRTHERVWKGTRSEEAAVRNAQMAVDHFGAGQLLDEIDTPMIDGFVEALEEEGKSNATINRKLAALSKLFTVAAQRGGARGKPYFPRKRESQGRIRYLTDDEEAALLSTFSKFGKTEHLDAVVVLLDTGMRCGELWRLRKRDIDHRSKLLHIWETKGDLPRSIPMTRRVEEVIKRRMMALEPGDKLFPYDNWWMRTGWGRVRDHLGYTDDPQFVPHMLRHTCASRLVQRGASLKVVQDWLGHKTISITMRYAHLAPQQLQQAANLLEGNTQNEAVEG